MRTNLRILVSLLAVSLFVTLLSAADALQRLGVTESDAKQDAIGALEYGSGMPRQSIIKAFKAVPVSARAALVTSGMEWLKAYSNTAEFKAAWTQLRAEKKPEGAAEEGSVADEMRKQRELQQKQFTDMRKAIKDLPADQQKSALEILENAEKQFKAMQTNPEMQAAVQQGIVDQRQEAKRGHESAMKDWEKNFPADSRVAIARRLKEFLAVSADVDFDAKLVARNGRMIFANADYEQKPWEWKTCYRAGKETVTAARQFATVWLGEIERK